MSISEGYKRARVYFFYEKTYLHFNVSSQQEYMNQTYFQAISGYNNEAFKLYTILWEKFLLLLFKISNTQIFYMHEFR